MAPTKSPNAILSETTTINSFVEQMIVLFGYWWSKGLVMIFYHACLLPPLTARQLTGEKVKSSFLSSVWKDFFTFLSLMRAIIQRVTAASVSGLYFVAISLFFMCCKHFLQARSSPIQFSHGPLHLISVPPRLKTYFFLPFLPAPEYIVLLGAFENNSLCIQSVLWGIPK